ncbi:IclR family transcriptional regulator [Virgibacillus necropolis]|uniref:IclR family transcriptional regulator n=1 Tax=Virgibacillus necropolis TaxID=163877 RepID=A0A221M9D5_9BACI|nr:IclR family transcriptional regulator [Virgibacillus necropolis]ASN04242.1 IclR family transcriptional regulator [Virgibacillus necropolis]
MLKTVNLTLEILKMFTREKPEWGGRELAHQMELNHTKVYRILETLTKNSFLKKDPVTKDYTLGIALWELGAIMYEGLNVKELIRPILEKLCEDTGESVFLTILDKEEGVTLDTVEPEDKVKFSVSIGSRAPLYVGASYRSILSYKSEEFIENIIGDQELKKYTKRTMNDPGGLKNELKKIKKEGWALSQGEYTEDVLALAVPLFDNNVVIGSVTLSGPTYRLSNKKIKGYLPLLKETRDEIEFVVTKNQLKLMM